MKRVPELIVKRLREIYVSKHISQRALARQFGMPFGVVSNILTGRTYKDIFFKPVARPIPIDFEFIRKLRVEDKLSYSKIADLEQIHSGRPVAYSGEHIRKVLNRERQCRIQEKNC